jgi:hypothetical protein
MCIDDGDDDYDDGLTIAENGNEDADGEAGSDDGTREVGVLQVHLWRMAMITVLSAELNDFTFHYVIYYH